jgi:hypothetical protein
MRAWKILVVICGSVLLTTVVIEASDTLYGSGGSLMARLISYEEPVCPMGMTHMPAALTFTCVDTFEASAGPSCVTADPANQFDTELNLARKECLPVAEEYNVPWRYITREQAAIACVRAGKRLPTAGEWYQFSLGTTPEGCNINSLDVSSSNMYSACMSAAGVFQTVGNVWEWVQDDVIEGRYNDRNLPESGFIQQVDKNGVATLTNETLDKASGYLWMNKEGSYGMIRGGFYGSKADAQVYTVHAQTPPTFLGNGLGFRCVK